MSNGTAPQVAATEFFYFCNALSAAGAPLGLALDENDNVRLQPWAGGQTWELWSLVDNGPTFSIVSAKSTSDTTLYLALSSSNQVVVQTTSFGWVLPETWNNTDPSSLPDYQIAGPIQTDNGSVALAGTASGAAIAAASPDGSAGQTWSIFPEVAARQEPRPQWVRIQTALTDDEKNVYVLDLADQNPLSNVVLALPSNSPTQFWQFTPDGALLNGVGGGLCAITSNGNSDSGYANLYLLPWNSAPFDGVTWSASNGMIVLDQLGEGPAMALDAGSSAYPGAPVGAYPFDPSSPTPGQQCTLSPTQTLPAILALPPTPFPQYTSGDELLCYAYVNKQLGLADAGTELRAQYLNLTPSFSDWRTTILALGPPAGLQDPSVWPTVQAQLASELLAVDGVNNLFNNYWEYHQNLATDMVGWQSDLVSAASVDDDTSTSGFVVGMVEGILRELVRAIPGAAPLMSLGTTAIDSAMAANKMTGDSFTTDVQDLWTTLSDNLETVQNQSALCQTVILADWGKLQAVSEQLSGPLAWPPLEASDLATSSQAGFTFSVMQLLLPAKYQIYTYQQDNDDPVDDIDSWAQSVTEITSQLYQASWIAERDDWDDEPAETAMTDAVGNQPGGGNWFNDTLSPWPFAVCWCYDFHDAGTANAVITVTNQSVRPMSMTVTSDPNVTPQSALLYPYSSTSIMATMNSDGEVAATVAITDAVSGAQLASFVVGLGNQIGPGETPVVSSITTADGYALSGAQCNQASFDKNYPGTVQITIATT